MLDTERATANIFKRIRSKTNSSIVNMMYTSNGDIFDQIIKEALPDICFIDKDMGKDIFTFDFTVLNEIFVQLSDINNIYNTYTDIIIFNHQDISNTKKEDLEILRNNLKNIKIINFNRNSDQYLQNALNINYPFPRFNHSVNSFKDVLIINNSNINESIHKSIFDQLKNGKISVDIISDKLEGNINTIYNQFSQYKTILDLSNRLNHILGLICGCNIVTHSNMDRYFESKYTIKFNNINEIVDTVKYSISKENNNNSKEEIKKQYSSENFEIKFKEYIYGNN